MVSILAHPYALLLGRLVLGGLFLFSDLGKTLDRQGTVRAVAAYGVLPTSLARVYGLLLPRTELLLAGLLLAGLLTRFAALGLSLLLLNFAIAVGVNLARGRQMDCGCFERAARERLGWGTLLRIVVLLAMAAGITARDGGQYALDSFVLTNRADPSTWLPLSGFLPVLVTALPAYLAVRLLAGVIVAGDQLNAPQATDHQALQKGAPVNFLLAHRHGDTQDLPPPAGVDAAGDQHRHISNLAIQTYLLVSGIQEQVDDLTQRPVAPGFQGFIQQGRSPADLGRRDGRATELLGDGRHFTSGNALHIHFRQCQGQGPLAAQPLLQGLRVEATFSNLGYVEGDRRYAGTDRLGLEAVGVSFDAQQNAHTDRRTDVSGARPAWRC